MENKKLHREGHGPDHIGELVFRGRVNPIQQDRDACVDENGEGDDGVLEAVEMCGRDGSIRVEWVVMEQPDEEVHDDGGCGPRCDEEELQVLES